jgi:hypothetical protein
MTVERNTQGIAMGETKLYYEREARWTPVHSTPEQVEPWP